MKKVSILILVREAGWLNTCIASVLRQTFKDFELLIGDDSGGSDVGAVVARWQDPRIIYLKNRESLGVVANRKHLLSLAKGQFIKILSARDFLYVNALEALVEVLEKTGAPLAFHNRRIVDAFGLIRDSPIAVPSGYTDVPFEVITQYIVAQRDNFLGDGSNMMFVRDLLSGIGLPFGVDTFEFRELEMLALSLKLSQSHPIVGVGCFGSASRTVGSDGRRGAPEDPQYHLIEWELLQRWALDMGYLPAALWPDLSIANLKSYSDLAPRVPKLDPFLPLNRNLAPPPFLSDDFRAAVGDFYAYPEHS